MFSNRKSNSPSDYGAGKPCDAKFSTMVDAVQQYVPKTTFVKGVPGVASDDTSGIANAAAAAKASDATVLVLGTDLTTAHEGHDATNLSLSAAQLQLAKTVAAAASPKPVVVVMMSAVPLDISPLLTDDNIKAILHAGQPSVQCLGVGDVLFGVVSPAGRMVQTLYPVSFQHQLSIFDMNMRPGPSAFPRPDGQGCAPGTKTVPCSSGTNVGTCTPDVNCDMGTNPGRTHRFFTGKAVIPFGFGLSYTSFSYGVVSAPLAAAGPVSLSPVHGLLASTDSPFPSLHASQAQEAAPVQYTVNVSLSAPLIAAEADPNACAGDKHGRRRQRRRGARLLDAAQRGPGRRAAAKPLRVRARLPEGGREHDGQPLPGAHAVHARGGRRDARRGARRVQGALRRGRRARWRARDGLRGAQLRDGVSGGQCTRLLHVFAPVRTQTVGALVK